MSCHPALLIATHTLTLFIGGLIVYLITEARIAARKAEARKSAEALQSGLEQRHRTAEGAH